MAAVQVNSSPGPDKITNTVNCRLCVASSSRRKPVVLSILAWTDLNGGPVVVANADATSGGVWVEQCILPRTADSRQCEAGAAATHCNGRSPRGKCLLINSRARSTFVSASCITPAPNTGSSAGPRT